MTETLKRIIRSNDKRMNLIIVLGLIGMVLILLSDLIPISDKSKEGSDDKSIMDESESYKQNIEEQLAGIIGDMEGVGKVSVMVTIGSTKEYIYAEKSDNDRKNTANEENIRNQSDIVLSGTGGKEPILKKIVTPQINGAAVICEGAADPITRERIINLLTAVLGLPTNRISVEPLR